VKIFLIPLFAIAVEYELDGPLDMKQKWGFVRGENFFVQHQCGEEAGKNYTKRIKKLIEKESPLRSVEPPMRLLQVRLLPGFDSYRRTFRFSKDRHGHYDEKLSLLTSYCGAATAILEEQLILHRLAETPLRLWQKIFIAETLAWSNPFTDATTGKPKPLRFVLLSNHRPEKAERATLRRLALFLQKGKKMDEFISALIRWRGFDDTGMEILETMFPEGLKVLEERITPAEQAKSPNNTLPGRK
jgi:hypothetical protein